MAQGKAVAEVKVRKWQQRVAAWKKPGAREKSLEFHLNHLHSEVSECFEELRAGHTPRETYFSIDKNGAKKPEGFSIELADVVLVALFIADLAGIDLEEAMERKMTYNEQKRLA